MIINRKGATYRYHSVNYTIGAHVVATDQSDYNGLYGRITEIRTGKDKDTENEGIDIYCEFTPPVHPDEIEELEARFSNLYGSKKELSDITFDFVIMAPEMIRVVRDTDDDPIKVPIFIVIEDWASKYDSGVSTNIFPNYDDAKRAFNSMLYEELDSGLLHEWSNDDSFVVDTTKDSYEAYLEGFATESHYYLSIRKDTLCVSPFYARKMHDDLMAEFYRRDFEEQLQKQNYVKLSNEEVQALVADPSVPDRITSKLAKGGAFKQAYWECIDSVIRTMLKKKLYYTAPRSDLKFGPKRKY